MTGFLMVVFLAWAGGKGPVHAQGIPFPPVRSDQDALLAFPVKAPQSRPALSYTRSYDLANNVLPLAQGNDESYPPRRFRGGTAFYLGAKREEVAWEHAGWRWSAGRGGAYVLRGNADAAQAWLDAKAENVVPGHLYRPAVAVSEATWQWLGGQRTFHGAWRDRPAQAWAGLRVMQAFRFREYSFSGAFLDERLRGDLTLLSSQGVGLPRSSGWGWGMHAGALWEWRPGSFLLLDVDGLASRVFWRRARELRAAVDTMAFAADPDGFVQDLPIFAGHETHRSLGRSLEPQWRLGASHPLGEQTLAVLAARRYSQYVWRVGVLRPQGRAGRLLLQISGPPSSFGVAYAGPTVSLSVGLSNPLPHRAWAAHLQGSVSAIW